MCHMHTNIELTARAFEVISESDPISFGQSTVHFLAWNVGYICVRELCHWRYGWSM